MLEDADLNRSLKKSEYQEKMDKLEKRLAWLQQKLKDNNIPVIIVLDGWSAAGKGTLMNKVLQPLDPRYFDVHTMGKVTEEQYLRPFLWRYFTRTPLAGRIAIFDKSWHRAVLPGGDEVSDKAGGDDMYYDINAFEEQLESGGTLILKFFLHISKDEQLKRFKELEKDEDTKWRVNEKNRLQNKEYDKFYSLFDGMMEKSGRISKWNVIAANDKRHAVVSFYETLIEKLEAALEVKPDCPDNSPIQECEPPPPDILGAVDLSKDITDDEYDKKLKRCQKQISLLGFKLYRKRRSVVIVYEGWDAAGKGGNIKRLTEELDPRGYDVYPVSAPTKEELGHHYLWRFWRNIPKDGHMAIFDRSWYGRVMVERVENLCAEDDWKRAYKEINDMELHLHHHGVIIIKFWLHIDKDEQLRRFESRLSNPLKRHKIVDEDWRNRAHWDGYLAAVNEMLHKTDTEYAPWVIVESNSKKYARIKVMEHVIKTLENEI